MTTEKAAWFLVRCEEGREKHAQEEIMKRAHTLGLVNRIARIAIPTRGIIVIRKGKKVRQSESAFGYLVVEMLHDEVTRQVLLDTPGVIEFAHDGPMTEEQLAKTLEDQDMPTKGITVKWEKP